LEESSDAHHISAPDHNQVKAQSAVDGALTDANISPDKIHYLNLHGKQHAD